MDTFRNQIHAWTFLPPLLTCTLQASNSASCKVSAVATPAKAVLSFHPSPPLLSTKSLPLSFLPFPQTLSTAQLCCCLPTAHKHLWSFPSLHWKTTLCKHFLPTLCYSASTIYLQNDQPPAAGECQEELVAQTPLAFTQQMRLLSLCYNPSQCK